MRRERNAARDDEGFSLIEVITALALLGTTMAAMGPFFIKSFQSVSVQRSTQSAVQLASSAIEQVRALKGSSLLTGRGKLKSTQQWNAAPAEVKTYLDTMQLAWDPLITDVASTLGDDAAISTAAQTMRVEQTAYSRVIYVGICDIYVGGSGSCVNPTVVTPPADAVKDLKFFRVVVQVTWKSKDCSGSGTCIYVASTLVARGSEPIFDFQRPAPRVKTTAVTFYRGVANSYQLEATGGQLPNTWTATPLPPTMNISSSGVVSGSPPANGIWNSQVKVTDKLGRSDTLTVVFTVVNPMTLTAPTSAQNHLGETVSQTLSATGGVSPYTYSATSLPTGLSLNATTGAITGTVTTTQVFTVNATVTDASGGTLTKTYTHTVYPVVALGAIADQTMTIGSTFSATAAGGGGNGTYTYAASGLPLGTSMNASTGVMSGLPTVPGRYVPTVTVTDSAGGTGGSASRTFVLIVNSLSSLIFTSPSLTAADQTSTAGVPASVSFATNGALLGLSPVLTATGMPPGMTFNALTGTISGTPTTPGVYKVTVLATNLLPPQTSNLTFLWTVK